MSSARDVTDRQLVAYNNHDLDAFCALFAVDAVLMDLVTGDVVARGIAEIRERYRMRFAVEGLRAEVLARMDLGDVAIDRETVHGLPEGPLELIAIYEVRDALIRNVRFVRA
jgi:hypothetical protein